MTEFPVLPPPPSCCRDVGSTMVGHFVTRLEVEAAKSGGSLTASQIRSLAQRFVAAEQDRFRLYYQRAWDDCSRLREAMAVESARAQIFDRLLMRRFAHLFPPRALDDGGEGLLSRRLIPGFTLAIDKIIGPERRARAERLGQEIVAAHPLPDGGWDWQGVHADPATAALVDETLLVVADSFAAFDRRRAWMIEMVNLHLSPTTASAPDSGWRLGDSGFAALMRALFAPTCARLATDPTAARAQWGDGPTRSLLAFLERMERA